MEPSTSQVAPLERWISAPRLRVYLDACGGDVNKAMELYAWNIGLAQAVLHDVALFEVALRNSYDRCLAAGFAGDWLFDANSPVRRPIIRKNSRGNETDRNRFNRRDIDRLGNSPAQHDWVVSNLTMGFWAHMTDKQHERDLWIPYLHSVWPKGTNRVDIDTTVGIVNRVRNRAVHHEHLFSPALQKNSPMAAGVGIERLFPMLVSSAGSLASGSLAPKAISRYISSCPAPVSVGL